MYRRTLPLLILALACGDSSGPANDLPAEVVGTWVASTACLPDCGMTFEPLENAADSLNFTVLGAATTFTLARSGTFTFNAGIPLTAPINGVMRMEGQTLVVQPTDDYPVEERIDFVLAGERLRLMWRLTVSYSVEAGQPAVPGRIRAVLERP